MQEVQDAYGQMIRDYHVGETAYEIIERDDGLIAPGPGPEFYFSKYEDWPKYEQEAIDMVGGRVLDIGCGAGRHILHCQESGLDVVGIDISPLAIAVCKLRGIQNAEAMAITQVSRKLGQFDSILMLGNNFGLFGSFKRARWLLKSRLPGITTKNARIFAASTDIYQTTDPDNLNYQQRNRDAGRMPGQIRLRVRYKRFVSAWFDYLLVSKSELEGILSGTPWRVKSYLNDEGARYIAVLERER